MSKFFNFTDYDDPSILNAKFAFVFPRKKVSTNSQSLTIATKGVVKEIFFSSISEISVRPLPPPGGITTLALFLPSDFLPWCDLEIACIDGSYLQIYGLSHPRVKDLLKKLQHSYPNIVVNTIPVGKNFVYVNGLRFPESSLVTKFAYLFFILMIILLIWNFRHLM